MNAGEKKLVLVTGASRGIGLSCAQALVTAGFEVLAGVRSRAAVEMITRLNLETLKPIQLDITNTASLQDLRNVLGQRQLYGLVNNAGIAVLGPLEYLPLDEIRREFEVNVLGHLAVTQTVLPALRASRGRIINMGSISGFIGFPYFGAYASSKFAMEGLSDSLRRELNPLGVRVVVVQPGNVQTDIWRDSYITASRLENQFPEDAAEIYGKRFSNASPEKYGPSNMIKPDDVADAVTRAMTDSKPACRYLVGKDAQRLYRLRRLLPDKWLDRYI